VKQFPCVSLCNAFRVQNYKILEMSHILSFDYLLPEDALGKHFQSDNIKAQVTGKNNVFEVLNISFIGNLKHATPLKEFIP
jgi:hypothetical protein